MERVLERTSTCIDVGCHLGTVLDEMLRLAPDGEHYAFEPLPDLFRALAVKYGGQENVHLFEAALGDSPGRVSFQHVVTNPAYSGLRVRRYDRPNEEVLEISVRVLRLDEVLPKNLPVRFIKIDVEGAELQVMRGAQAVLRRWRPYVVFEHGLGAADHYGTRPEAVFDLLTDCGLRLSLMKDWIDSGGKDSFSCKQFVEEFEICRNYYFLAHP